MENARIIGEALKRKGALNITGGEIRRIYGLNARTVCLLGIFDYLLNNAQIVGTPGAGFGNAGEGYFRLTSFSSREIDLRSRKGDLTPCFRRKNYAIR